MYSENSITKPLSLSGGYAGDNAHKRQLETVRFWIDVSDPGGLDKGPPVARGRATAMRVRVMHVFIGGAARAHGVGSGCVGGADLDLGRDAHADGWKRRARACAVDRRPPDDDREIEALLHYWRYIGHLLGVQPSWYPEDFRQSVQLMFAALVKRAYSAGAMGRSWWTPTCRRSPDAGQRAAQAATR